MEEKTLDIYTDCSGNKKIFGLGVLFIDNKEKETKFNYKTNTSLINKEFGLQGFQGATYLGECYALYKSLVEITTSNILSKKKYSKITIYTDNMFVYDGINNLCKKWGRNGKKYKKYKLFMKIINKCKNLMNNFNIEVRHIKAHCGVYGNEIADRLAKTAYKRKSMPYCNGKSKPINLLEYNFYNSFKLEKITF